MRKQVRYVRKRVKIRRKKKLKNSYAVPMMLSLLSLVTCIAMLSGTTFAWFTDSVQTGVTRVKSGNMALHVVGYNTIATSDSSFQPVKSGNGNDSQNPIVFNDSEDNERKLIDEIVYPGSTNVKFIVVSNTGTIDFNYKLTFLTPSENDPESDDKLPEVIWYKVGKVSGLKDQNTFGSIAEETQSYGLLKDISEIALEGQLGHKAGDTTNRHVYRLEYGMLESAGATYLNSQLTLDITVEAKQTNDNS